MSKRRKPIRETPTDGWMSLADAAFLLGVSRYTVQNLVIDGSIQATRMTGRIVISRTSVEQYMKAQERKTQAEAVGAA
jgi:excisionase family DNA binding protein